MRKGVFTIFIVLLLSLSPLAQGWQPNFEDTMEPVTGQAQEQVPPSIDLDPEALLSDIRGSFIENLGQKGEGAGHFYCEGSPLSVAFGEGWLAYFYEPTGGDEGWCLKIRFDGANAVGPEGTSPRVHRSNYFIGNDPDAWMTGARSFEGVLYRDLWDGIDLRFHLSQRDLKYEFVVTPGSDPSTIVMQYDGATSLTVSGGTGDLLIGTPVGSLRDSAPLSYQDRSGARETVPSFFRLVDKDRVGFHVDSYDPTRTLVIDPGLVFSTLIGGSGGEWCYGQETGTPADLHLSVGPGGEHYLAGMTRSLDFPTTPGAFNNTSRDMNGVVLKLSEDGSDLLTSTYLGGSNLLWIIGLEVDGTGNAYVLGITESTDMPITPGAYQESNAGGWDLFVLGLNETGSGLLFCTYLGGQDDEYKGTGHYDGQIELDRWGNVLVGANTYSGDFPTVQGCFDTTFSGDRDGIIAILNHNGTQLKSSTFLGGDNSDMNEFFADLIVDGSGYIYAVGGTRSDDFPTTPDAYQGRLNGGVLNGYFTKFNPDLSDVEYSTYMRGYSWLSSICIDDLGHIYVAGIADPLSVFPTTPGAFDTTYNGRRDTVIVKFTHNLTDLEYSTFMGGSESEASISIDVDELGKVYFVFCTRSTNLPTTPDAYDHNHTEPAGPELFVGCLAADGGSLVYSSYFGGSTYGVQDFAAKGIHRGYNSTVFAGWTTSSNFPTTPGAYQTTANGGGDWFITRMWTGPATNPDPPSPPNNLTAVTGDRTVILSWDPPADNGGAPIRGYQIYRGDTEDALEFHDTVLLWEQFVDRPKRFGKPFFYAVTAFNFKQTSDMSEVVNATPFGSPWMPENFTASTEGGRVYLNWTPPSDTGGYPVLGYVVGRGDSRLNNEEYDRIGDVTSYVDDRVIFGETYSYRIRAYNSYGDGKNTTDLFARPLDVPARIPIFRITPDDGIVHLDWSLPPNDGGSMMLGFRVLRGTSRESLDQIWVNDPSTSYHEDSNVTNGMTYYYSVVAFNELGDGPLSETIEATPLGVPGTPYEFEGNGSDRQVELTWRSPSLTGGAKQLRYRIFRGTTNDEVYDIGSTNTPSYTDDDVENGQTYFYQVSAFNDLWEGTPTQFIEVRPLAPPGPPAAFNIVTELGHAELVWAHPADTGGADLLMYRIYRGVDPVTMEELVQLPPTVLRYTDSDVEGGITYHYYVVGVTEAGEGTPSITHQWTPVRLPGEPFNLVAGAGAGYVDLSWNEPMNDGGKPVIGFVIRRGTSESDFRVIATTGYVTEYTDNDVDGGVTYYYHVLARNEIGNGAPSDQAFARPWWVPEAPRSFEVDLKGTTATLLWQSPESDRGSLVTGYLIMRGTTEADMDELIRVGLVIEYVDEGLERGETYYYHVAAVNAAGVGDQSQILSIEVSVEAEPVSYFPWWIILVGLGILMAGMISVMGTETGRYRWGLLLGPLTTRLKREEVLDNKTRHALLGIIIASPGIHYKAIMREFDLKNGVAAYHLSVLEEKDYIRSVRDGRLKRFYSVEAKVPKDQRLTPEEIRETIVELVESNPGISQRSIVNELGIDDDTVGYHLRSMVSEGELSSVKKGRNTVYTRDT